MKLIQRSGLRYGRLVVLEKHIKPRMWLCKCDCGTEKCITGSSLANGTTKSCGCLAREWAAKMGSNPEYTLKRSKKITVHGNKRSSGPTVEYRTWLSMKRRCYDTKYKDYSNWGGRGITVCERWKNSFTNFFSDMGSKPEGHSIDRRDENGHYCPENCRWATALEQGENMRPNIEFHYRGVFYNSMKEACRALGLRYTTIFSRVSAGYSIAQALSIGNSRPVSKRTAESYWKKSRRTV